MPKDKIIFTLCQMEAILFSILRLAAHAVLNIGKHHLNVPPVLAGGIFSHVMCLDLSHGSGNI